MVSHTALVAEVLFDKGGTLIGEATPSNTSSARLTITILGAPLWSIAGGEARDVVLAVTIKIG